MYQSGAYVPPNLCTFVSEEVRKKQEAELVPNIKRIMRQRKRSGNKEALMMPFTGEELFGAAMERYGGNKGGKKARRRK